VVSKKIRPIIQITELAEEIANGNLRLEMISVASKDEIGKLSGAMNKMLNNLYDLVQQVSQSAATTAATSQQLAASAVITGQTAEQVAIAISEIATGSTQQSDDVSKVVQMMEENVSEMERGGQIAERTALEAMESSRLSREGAALKTIVEHVAHTEKETKQVQHIFAVVESNVRQLMAAIESISQIIEESAATTQQVAAATQEQTASIQEVTASSDELAILSRQLEEKVARFNI
jgi:methyl-accepting chemotaxis protein